MRKGPITASGLSSVAAVILLGLLIWSCGDVATDPSALPELYESPLIVSEPVWYSVEGAPSTLNTPAPSFLQWSATGSDVVSFVSYPPGSFPPPADSIEIHNARIDLTVGASMFDGGVDPVQIPAAVGDTLEITVMGLDGTYVFERTTRIVPAKEPPVVVRTDPSRRRTKVPLNARIAVVFSEPVDASTVSSETIQLLDGTEPIPSGLTLSDDGIRAQLIPDTLLKLETTYTISVKEGIRDVSGSNLPENVTSEFTTTDEVGSVHVTTMTADTGAVRELHPDGYV
ncbi:MAG: Ig-like domain-containing protein, partial [Longimicrobiales bacterium]|nr:Ig-like domain-containing protein [Longimicrobiales bacterium]